jgi:hypothetical protein
MCEEIPAPTEAQVEKYTILSPMLDSALSEMREFAKKKQDAIVSEMKIKVLNRLLADLKAVLAQQDSANYLDLLNEEELPQNGDVVLMLAQYQSALKSFKDAHSKRPYGELIWYTREHFEELRSLEDEEEYDEEVGEYDKVDADDDDGSGEELED